MEKQLVNEIPNCDFCWIDGKILLAKLFGQTKDDSPARGADANMCAEHHEMYGKKSVMLLEKSGMTILILLFSLIGVCHADKINLNRIAQIESSGNPQAIGPGGDIGLFQVTPILLRDFNSRTGHHYLKNDMFDADNNTQVASWYLLKRIPQMLRHYGIAVTTRNIIIAYNAGIKILVYHKPLPTITVRYLKKYFA